MSYDPQRAIERRRQFAEIEAELKTIQKKLHWRQGIDRRAVLACRYLTSGAMFARISTVTDFTVGLKREGAKLVRPVASPATAITDLLVPDILKKCGRQSPHSFSPKGLPWIWL